MSSEYVNNWIEKYADKTTHNYMDALETINGEMEDYGGWAYTYDGCYEIVTQTVMAKANPISLFSKHPQWNEEHLRIALSDTHYSRDVDKWGCKVFCDRFCNMVWRALLSEDIDKDKIVSAIKHLTCTDAIIGIIPMFNPNDYAEPIIQPDVAECCNSLLEEAGIKTRFSAGQKRSKAVSKLARELHIPDMPEDWYGTDFRAYTSWGTEFAHYGDAINPLNITKWTVISLNPIDFLMSSNGDSWASCYNPNKNTYSGCNCSGGISSGLDTNTICMYTVDAEYNGETFELEPKHTRAWAGIWDDFKAFWLLKVYPYSYESHFNEFKAILERVIADCLDVPNLWKINTKHEDVNSVLMKGSGATVYPDWRYINNGQGTPIQKAICWLSGAESPIERGDRMPIGARPICVECGGRHSNEDEINCCTRLGAYKYCENCESEIENEDDECYSDFHNAYGCRECMEWNSWCDDYFWRDGDTTWVENLGEYIPDCYIRRYYEDFVTCEYCGEWLYIGSGYRNDYEMREDPETGEVFFYCNRHVPSEEKYDPDDERDAMMDMAV